MLIGVDFDNTIVCYDQIFHRVALERGLIPHDLPESKEAVRDYLRSCDLEDVWIEMQGYVYGARIADASAFMGAMEFLGICESLGLPVRIISHRTRYPFAGEQYDLHRAAYTWLEAKGLVGNYGPQRVFFELTKQDKLMRISAVGCTHFIDDLPEFLAEPEFPTGVQRILFDPSDKHTKESRFLRAKSWQEIADIFLRTTLPGD